MDRFPGREGFVIATAEAALDTTYATLWECAAALLRNGEATLAEVSEVTGLNQGELLDLLSRNIPGREPTWKQYGTTGLLES